MIKRAAPWLQESDALIVPRELAKLQQASDAIYQQLQTDGYFDEDGNPRPAVDALRRLALAEEKLAASLGLTVRSRIEIQAGSRFVPIDTAFEARVERAHAERHAEDSEE